MFWATKGDDCIKIITVSSWTINILNGSKSFKYIYTRSKSF